MAWIETRKATATKFLDPASHCPLRLPVKVRPVSLYQQELFLKQQRNQILKRGVRLPYLKILNVRLGAKREFSARIKSKGGDVKREE